MPVRQDQEAVLIATKSVATSSNLRQDQEAVMILSSGYTTAGKLRVDQTALLLLVPPPNQAEILFIGT